MRKALQQNLIRRFQVNYESAYSVTLGPLWATHIHTSALTFSLRRTLSFNFLPASVHFHIDGVWSE